MVAIVDRYGRPFEQRTLDEPQTASMVHLQREFAGHPTRGLTPSKLARILDDAEQGDIRAQYEAFEDMEEKDGHVASEMGKRRRAVAGLEWSIEPPLNPTAAESTAAARVAELVAGIAGWQTMLFDATDAIGKGFACLEIEWRRTGRSWLPLAIDHRPQTWFQLHRGSRQEIRLRDHSADGAPLNPFGWITHVHRAKSGYIERAALMRVLIWPFVFKNYSVGDLAEFLEIYGIPMRLGKYPSGATEADKRTLMRALVHIGHNAAGIIPAGMEVDFHDIANGDAKAFEVMLDWCERTQSKAILGGTLTSQADRGSNTNALGNVHNDVRIDLRDSDALQVAATVTRDLIYPVAVLNGLAPDSPERSPRLVFNTRQPEDLKLYADALPKLVQMGMDVPVDWARQQLRVPKPKDGEAVLTFAKAAPATATAAATAQVRFTAQPERADAITDTLSELLQDAADPIVAEWVDQIRGMLASASSLEEFRDALLAQFEELPTDQLQTLMRQALMGADLAGRSVVKSQSSGRGV
ncbi:DUF935 domain-containing protein [Tahibacter soli]|uniref:DUF935 domain-containing protein n=1 Tax=Tahibacter soli TaxID=2983605 RepID=A0A9X4BJ63_9GAMM|nr:DUF935 domain-containing protein [Tahibacter soli]MDC8012927.1 DUF935 domain-containing protein [Tahibacter soli]